MIVGADKRVSRAFLATLREEPSAVDLSAAFQRKEKERTAILTVSGLAHAIARAEEHMREQQRSRASQPDIFAELAATDDCAGPAVYRPYTPTPIPPRAALAVDETLVMPRIPTPPLPVFAAPSATPAPILVLDPQAFYHPAGPIPGFAPRARRGWLAWAALAVGPLAALVLLACVVAAGRGWTPKVGASMPATAPATAVEPARVERAPAPPPVEPPPSVEAEQPAMLVVDVNSLKPAKPRKR